MHVTGEPLEATILEVQRMSTEDGPGIRTTVFFKGCPLACRWCHNPESIAAAPELVWHGERCITCGACIGVCPTAARSLGPDGPLVDARCCVACGHCVDACPTVAAERLGTRRTVGDLVDELLRDRAFFDAGADGGGVTLSGGEPTSQARFVGAVLDRCRAAGVHTALDTCGVCGEGALRGLVRRVDLVLFDVKAIDAGRHAELTGRSNERILANARAVADEVRRAAGTKTLWIRTPLVPGATADEENVRGIGAFLAAELGDAVARWELCAFNPLCEDKYRRLGRTWDYAGVPSMTASELAGFVDVARASGVAPEIVVGSGPTRA